METPARWVWVLLFLSVAVTDEVKADDVRNITAPLANATSLNLPKLNPNVQGSDNKNNYTHVVLNSKNRRGGYFRGGGGGGGGWGWGGGGGGYYKWGCGGKGRGKRGINNKQLQRKRIFNKEDYIIGEYAQCTVKGRCKGMRLDCPLHCGGPCFYDCLHMCKAHCRR